MAEKPASTSSDKSTSPANPPGFSPPQIGLPKGGGAIRGIDEKFSANPATGTGSLSVPIGASSGRSGFGPELSLSYDSGAGNGQFGFGWTLSLPSIKRKTDKGLPRYYDADESDVFILSGAEDLVPVFKRNPDGTLAVDKKGNCFADEETRDGYVVKRYRPRIEGLFARIERWTRVIDGDTHWRSISKDNVLTVYGGTSESRIADPENPQHIFSWLICQSYDDKGNAIQYEYVAENSDNVALPRINERDRVRSANRYLKYVRYGNRQPLLIDPTAPSFRRSHVPSPDFTQADWMFEIVFDYGEGHYQQAAPDPDGRIFAAATLKPPVGGTWAVRSDPFSNYRSGFEVRTYRLCRRVLVFHHFPAELGLDDYLVRSSEFSYREQPNGSFLTQAVQSGFKWITAPTSRYLRGSLPPLEFGYSTSPLDDLTYNALPLQEVDATSLENLPSGIDNSGYRWVDLDGEGISGVLTESADSWFYKPNLGDGRFGPVESVSPRPSFAALNGGRQQLLDLAGDGTLDLVEFSSSTPGFFSRNDDASWDRFRAFRSLPDVDWQDPNLRFVDLTGDGHADVLISEDQAFSVWHESYAEEGFGPALRATNPLDEEKGPRVVFADGTQSIYLADMSGDGLTDLVRVRNGEVSYWPNLGYGRFGTKVSLDNVPWFDDAESFDQRRVHLADTDGSGPTDIIYLGRDGIRIYLNQHGNSLSDARVLDRAPTADNQTAVSVADFLGHGTACVLWSSAQPADTRRPLRYLDLMGGIKPHLLTTFRNNLGSETKLEYKSSTEFYLAAKAAGTPWVTRLPFPVHLLTRVETNDLISGNRFSTTYTYHHGYFDGFEREFRGFGRVDQRDTEEFGALAPASNLARAFYVPATLTKTWFHTGAYFTTGERISRGFEDEYYCEEGLNQAQLEAMLLADTVLPEGLSDSERREAVRSLKGAILRQEIYALDGKSESSRPYSVSERNYVIKALQPQAGNRHSVFFTHEQETIDFHYERKLFPVVGGNVVDASQNPAAALWADPRVSHQANLVVDEYGNVLQSADVGYGRRFDDSDSTLTDADRKKQKQAAIVAKETRFTNVVVAADAYRAPLPAEEITFELLKVNPSSQLRGVTNLFRFDELLSAVQNAADGTHDLAYEDFDGAGASGTGPFRRPVERKQVRYRSNNLVQMLPLASLQALAIAGETYKLAFTPGLLNAVYQRQRAGQGAENLLPSPGNIFPADAGRWSDRGGYVDLDGDGNWWIPSGRVFFHPDSSASAAVELAEATAHFFMPRRFRDPFLQSTIVDYAKDLFPERTRDPLGNTVEAIFDYRILQATQITDPNGNQSFAKFDALGLAVASAVRGKASELLGDSLADFGDLDADLSLRQIQEFVRDPQGKAGPLLKNSTSRIVYDLARFRRCSEPPFAATLARETHASDPVPAPGLKIQVSFAYSDGFGREVQYKIPAEPDGAALRGADVALPGGDIQPGPLTLDSSGAPILGTANPRWVGTGRTVYNNKGKPIKQYEPFFSSTHLYEPEPEMTDTGVTPILFYDPADRVVATLHPNHTYEKVVFDPWRQETWDVNDTVTQSDPTADADVGDFFKLLPKADYWPTWYEQRRNGQKGQEEKGAADKAAAHANTPTVAHFDTLGRQMLTVADNGVDSNGVTQKYATRLTLDIEGNQRAVMDAKNRLVMRYDYDMLGNRISQASMEAGQRWMLNDATGKPLRNWDSRAHNFRNEYDALRRAVHSFVVGSDPAQPGLETCVEISVYGESSASGLSPAQVLQANLRGKIYKHYGTAGVSTSELYDFNGNLLRSTLQLTEDYKTLPDWSKNPVLEAESFVSTTSFDALNRPIQLVAPHSNQAGARINVLEPRYNEANLLERMDAWVGQAAEPSGLLDPASANLHAVTNVDYNAKGQRTRVDYGNGASTEYFYDQQTLRLVHLKTSRASTTPPGLLGRLLGRSGTPTSSVLQDLFYTYDPAGNITHIRDDAQETIYFNNQVVLPISDYTYDPLYRLTQATGREHIGQLAEPQTSWDDQFRRNLPHPGDGAAMRNYTEQYFYDGAGNFDRLVHQATNGSWTRTYAYNEASLLESAKKSNRLSSTSVGAATDVYTHDAHGNMSAMPHLTLMEWGFRDQLSATSRQAVNPAPPPGSVAQTTFYVYDSRGERVRKVTESQAGVRREERIYLGGFEIYRKFAPDGIASDLERETLHVMDDQQRVALVESRTKGNDGSPAQLTRYQFGNHQGSVNLELDDQGAVISYEEYYAYGSTSYQAVDQKIKAVAKRYRYTGKERDEENGFSYHSARYYMTWLGRWLSADPSGLSDGINLYAYCHNSPMVFADHTGMDADTESLKAGAAKTEGFRSIVDAAVKNYVNPSTGLTTADFLTLINIESSGHPKASTGTHKGLFQLSKKDNYDSREFAAARRSGFNKTAADRNFKWTKQGILDPTTNIRYGTFVVNERIRLANESIGRKAKVLAAQTEIATDKAKLQADKTAAQASLGVLKDKQKHLKRGLALTTVDKSQMKALREQLKTFSGKFSDIKTRENQNAADLELETKLEPGNLLLKQFMKDHPAAAAYLLHQQGISGLRSILSNPGGNISGKQRKNLTPSAKSSVTTNQQWVDFWVKRFDQAKSFVKQ